MTSLDAPQRNTGLLPGCCCSDRYESTLWKFIGKSSTRLKITFRGSSAIVLVSSMAIINYPLGVSAS